MNINWKVRIKNPLFWAEIGLAVLVPILGYFVIKAADLTTWKIFFDVLLEAVKNPYVFALVVVSVWNAIVDPTTKGVSDSKQAMTYTNPKVEVEE